MTIKNKILIKTKDLIVDFPTYIADRSLKRTIAKISTGGRLASDSKSRIAVRALDGINIEINPGDKVGIIGHNGSGKTTLLKVLTGVYYPTYGELEVHGRIRSLLDISLGLDDDGTGWENIYLRGLMVGMSPAEIQNRVDEIADFSGLGKYIDLPIRTYSSGMKIRLAFSVSTALHADILILDEWLSVGDEEFQKKASKRINELIDSSSIMILASHSVELLKKICNRLITLEHGKIILDEIIK